LIPQSTADVQSSYSLNTERRPTARAAAPSPANSRARQEGSMSNAIRCETKRGRWRAQRWELYRGLGHQEAPPRRTAEVCGSNDDGEQFGPLPRPTPLGSPAESSTANPRRSPTQLQLTRGPDAKMVVRPPLSSLFSLLAAMAHVAGFPLMMNRGGVGQGWS
jgi:hypothetical protein